MKALLYLHGFDSSAQSLKARQTRAWAAQHSPQLQLHFPNLPNNPEKALILLEKTVENCHDKPGLIGSSMGGFFATVLSERYGLAAVLINPAVHPHRLLRHYLGPRRNPQTGESYELTPAHMDILRVMETPVTHPERLLVLLKKGDETLDYRLAEQWYHGCTLQIDEGGDHAFTDYEQRLPAIFAFLQARTS